MGKHYLYRHIREDLNQPFYVGIGTKAIKPSLTIQSEYRRGYSKSRRSSFWKNIVNQTEYEVEILLESDDYNFIKQKEIEFIALYGRRDLGKGTLCNLTDGGDGTLGCNPSTETRKRIGESGKGRVYSEESRKKKSDSLKAWYSIEENRQELRERVPSGDTHPYAKLILNPQTGIYYGTIKEGAIAHNLTESQLSSMLTGKCLNTTYLIYAESDNGSLYPNIPKLDHYFTGKHSEEALEKMRGERPNYQGENCSQSKKVINKLTGELYGCRKELTDKFGYSYGYYGHMLNPNGTRRNTTPYEYYDPIKHQHLLKQTQ